MNGFMLCALFATVLLALDFANCDESLTAEEYQSNLGIGFAVSWFKVELRKHYTPESLKVTLGDMVERGIGHLRLRCMARVHGFPDSGNYADPPPTEMDQAGMAEFLDELEFVVDEMLKVGLYPVISWIGKHITARGSEQDGRNYVQWWTEVARRLQDKSPKVAFDLVTEMERNMDKDAPGIEHNLHENITGLSNWMRRAILAIRGTGGNNAKRVIMLVTPQNTKVDSLSEIAEDLYDHGPIIQEFHTCAAGYKSKDTGRLAKSRCVWTGNAELWEKTKLRDQMDRVIEFGRLRGVPIYFGAWMAYDQDQNTDNGVRKQFAAFFTKTMKGYGIPSTINEINKYYDAKTNEWIKEDDIHQTLNAILNQWNQ